jgi:surface antigen/outer membrane murein-binding lipoprotein Lpp
LTRGQKLILLAGSLGTLLATGIGSIPATQATTSSVDDLRAQRAALVAELAAMQPDLSVARGNANAAEAAYSAQQSKVLGEQAQLASLNKQMLALNSQLTDDQATVTKDKHQLGIIVRATFENSGNAQVLAAILSANDFSQAMDRLRNASHVNQQVTDMVTRLAAKDAEIKANQAQIQKEVAAADAIEGDLSSQSARLFAALADRNGLYSQLNGPARAIAAKIADLDQQISCAEAGPNCGAASSSGPQQGSCGNHFAYGQCTWYVASRRCVPWMGNARDWYYNAAAMGYPEGHSPQPGAIVVFWPGGDGASSSGHVAYVEAVGPADGIPDGMFKMSEMNYGGNGGGWGRVSYRTLPNNSGGIQGFIYFP